MTQSNTPRCPSRRRQGFTLIELMVAVAIVGILAAIAIPSYSSYVLRSHLVSATDQLSNSRALMEQYFQDNRQYTAVSATVTPPCATVVLTGDGYFDVSCTGANAALTATTYTIVATGVAATSVANFVYTVAQDGTIATLNLGSWGAAPAAHACWIVKQGQTC